MGNEGAYLLSAEEREAVFEAAWQKGGFHFWAGTFSDINLDEQANRMAYDFGAVHDLDVVVLATGFDANTGGVVALDLVDVDGLSIAERWVDGVDTHLGMAIPGVPNMLLLYGPQSPAAFCNGPTCAEIQGEWIVDLLVSLSQCGLTRFDATTEAAATWTARTEGRGRPASVPRSGERARRPSGLTTP